MLNIAPFLIPSLQQSTFSDVCILHHLLAHTPYPSLQHISTHGTLRAVRNMCIKRIVKPRDFFFLAASHKSAKSAPHPTLMTSALPSSCILCHKPCQQESRRCVCALRPRLRGSSIGGSCTAGAAGSTQETY